MTGWLVTFAAIIMWAGILLIALALCAAADRGDRQLRCTDEDEARLRLYPERRR